MLSSPAGSTTVIAYFTVSLESKYLNYSLFRMPLQVMDVPKYSHITPVLYELHWLPVHARIQFQVLLFAFKTIHDLAPSYIKDLINVKSKSSFNLRSNNGTLLEPPADRMLTFVLTTLGARSFHAAAPSTWYTFTYIY